LCIFVVSCVEIIFEVANLTTKKLNHGVIRKKKSAGFKSKPDKIIKLAKPSQKDVLQLGSYYRQGRFSDVLSFAEVLLQKFQPTDLVYNYYGLALEAQGDLKKAIQSYRKAILIDPNFADGHHNLALSLKSIGNIGAAIDGYAKAISINPEHFIAHNNLGNALCSIGKLEEAIKSYSKAIKVNPNFSEAYFNMGNVFRSLDLPKKAIKNYRIAVKKKPNFVEAHNYLGITLNLVGEIRAGIKELEQATKLKPDYAEAHNNLGKAFYYIGRIGDSLQKYNEALFYKGNYAEAYCNRATLFLYMGRDQDSIKDYKTALKIKPNYSEAYFGLGNAWNLIGEENKALVNYNKAIQLNPNHLSSKYMVASLTGKAVFSAPKEYVRDLFDNFAGKFDNSLIGKLNYKAPTQLMHMFANAFGQQIEKFSMAVDLGCGTGLAGKAFRKYARFMVGIDLSKNMIEKARKKKIYDELIVEDFSKVLGQRIRVFDLFICIDVFIYFGDLSEIFKLLRNRSRSLSVLAFSTEHSDKRSFTLSRFGRFSHSKNYIHSLINEYGFELVSFRTENLRKEGKKWVKGDFYLARRTKNNFCIDSAMVA